jgi:hypothetical protein
MRKPDSQELYDWKGLVVTVRTWNDPTECEYDGEFPEDAEGCEGWDLLVEVSLDFDGQSFTAFDSLCSNWVWPDREGDDYIKSQCAELRDQALDTLSSELRECAEGKGVAEARARQDIARKALEGQS